MEKNEERNEKKNLEITMTGFAKTELYVAWKSIAFTISSNHYRVICQVKIIIEISKK